MKEKKGENNYNDWYFGINDVKTKTKRLVKVQHQRIKNTLTKKIKREQILDTFSCLVTHLNTSRNK